MSQPYIHWYRYFYYVQFFKNVAECLRKREKKEGKNVVTKFSLRLSVPGNKGCRVSQPQNINTVSHLNVSPAILSFVIVSVQTCIRCFKNCLRTLFNTYSYVIFEEPRIIQHGDDNRIWWSSGFFRDVRTENSETEVGKMDQAIVCSGVPNHHLRLPGERRYFNSSHFAGNWLKYYLDG